jgi:hypothetical protein
MAKSAMMRSFWLAIAAMEHDAQPCAPDEQVCGASLAGISAAHRLA